MYIYIIFQRYKVINKSQNSRNKVFSYSFCLMIEGSGAQKHTDPTDPDPQHCMKVSCISWIFLVSGLKHLLLGAGAG